MNKVWKAGLVGLSRGSAYGNLLYRHPRFDIVALCDISEQSLAKHQKDFGLQDSQCFTNYEEFISSGLFEAVIIGTPIPFHAEQAEIALDAGLHVMSEVTASNTIDGCARIIKAVKRSGKIYMLAENTIFRPLFRDWERLYESGKIGEIIYAEADYLHPIPSLLIDPVTGEKKWRADRPPIHYCSHSLGPILYITKDQITRAMAIGDGHRIIPSVPIGGVDVQIAVFETKNKMIIKMTRTQSAPRHPPIHYYYMLGTNGFVETDRAGIDSSANIQRGLKYIKSEMEHAKHVEWSEIDSSLPDYSLLGGHGTSDYQTLLAFLDALDTGQKPRLDEISAWNMTVPGLIAAESAKNNGKWMDVPSPDQYI